LWVNPPCLDPGKVRLRDVCPLPKFRLRHT